MLFFGINQQCEWKKTMPLQIMEENTWAFFAWRKRSGVQNWRKWSGVSYSFYFFILPTGAFQKHLQRNWIKFCSTFSFKSTKLPLEKKKKYIHNRSVKRITLKTYCNGTNSIYQAFISSEKKAKQQTTQQ